MKFDLLPLAGDEVVFEVLQCMSFVLLPLGVAMFNIFYSAPLCIICVFPCLWLLSLLLSKGDMGSLMCAMISVPVVPAKARWALA